VLLFFVGVLIARALEVLNPEILQPVLTRLHIPPPKFTLYEVIAAAARKHQINPAFVKSIIAAESGFSEVALSPKGAVGLMQLMPETAREFGADPVVLEQNIDAGTRYLSWLMQRYRGVPPYRETRTYVTRAPVL
jgi:hypothetical protein